MDFIFPAAGLVAGLLVGDYLTFTAIVIWAVIWGVLSWLWISKQGLDEMEGGFFILFMGTGWGAIVGAFIRSIILNWSSIEPSARPILDLFIRR